jgi:cytochrome c oxidase cbb3-type subunit 4
MDINLIRSLVTVAAFVSFVGIVLWAWSNGARAGFERAAQIPFDEDADNDGAGNRGAMQKASQGNSHE